MQQTCSNNDYENKNNSGVNTEEHERMWKCTLSGLSPMAVHQLIPPI